MSADPAARGTNIGVPPGATPADTGHWDVRAFVRSLKHDLRTPINHIIGYSEMLAEESADRQLGGLAAELQQVRATGRQLLDRINDALDLDTIATDSLDLDAIGHELHIPLDALIVQGERLHNEAIAHGLDDFVPDLQKVQQAVKQLCGLIDATLDLAKAKFATGELVKLLGRNTLVVDVPGADQLSPPSTVVAAGEPVIEGASVLVVDDNELNRDMLIRRLARLGYDSAVAANGREALERLRDAPVDLILLDIMMPEVDGYQVLAYLKADKTLRHIPVIVLSAVDELDSIVRCIEMGAEDYLPKPFDPILLRARIGACLEKKRLRDREARYLRRIEEETQRANDLLHVILPAAIVAELKATNTVQPRRYEHVAVLFCDIVGFTSYCDGRPPQEVLPLLQRLVEAYEEIALGFDLQKIKTIGDAFMATAGLLKPVENPVLNCVRAGLEMITWAQDLPAQWDVRVGIHVGPVVAGVLGRRQYLFDLWGDTVNTAARMESHGRTGAITLSRAARDAVAQQCRCEALGRIAIKGKGAQEIFLFQEFSAT